MGFWRVWPSQVRVLKRSSIRSRTDCSSSRSAWEAMVGAGSLRRVSRSGASVLARSGLWRGTEGAGSGEDTSEIQSQSKIVCRLLLLKKKKKKNEQMRVMQQSREDLYSY